ncbi:HSP90 [Blackcurrant leafroll-associated virus 1]|uniref:HSP90 n=1 Tax=Blackcurrant leafroll-associated virus 1 TaxID=2292426 RepID=UPI000E32D839|nr:HSP90 [Blackcurrant leafroll-associated virus 1]AXN56990.1 HSP90 [Blackcurrant leafroll-associated virus 1]
MNQTPLSYSWGDLFKVFYGVEDSNAFLSEAIKNYNPDMITWGHKKSTGGELPCSHLKGATGDTIVRELCLLHYSVAIYGFAKLCGVRVNSMLKGIESYTAEDLRPSGSVTNMTKFESGCKFSLNTVGQHVINRPAGTGRAYVQHFWALSNSAGQLIGPSDILKYKSIVFKETLGFQEKVEIELKLRSYLAFCVASYRSDYLSKSTDERVVVRPVLKWLEDYYSTTTLSTDAFENPLLVGLFLEFISKYTVFDTTFKKNVMNLQRFINEYAPMIADIWEYEGAPKSQDPRIIVGLHPDDFSRNLNSLSLDDMEVTLSGVVNSLEIVIGEQLFDDIEMMVDALLSESNPTVDYSDRWVGFFVYYGIHRTNRDRIDKRPDYIDVAMPKGRSVRVRMVEVENFFHECQRWNPNINIRRSFNGRKSSVAFEIFKRLNLGFRPLVEVKLPINLDYLNVDYYKQVTFEGLNNDEIAYLNIVRKKVDLKLGAKISLKPKKSGNPRKQPTFLEKEREKSDNKHLRISKISKSLISLTDL